MTECPTNHAVLVIRFTSLLGKGRPVCKDCDEPLTSQEWLELRIKETEEEFSNVTKGDE